SDGASAVFVLPSQSAGRPPLKLRRNASLALVPPGAGTSRIIGRPVKLLTINEVFYSVQGESSYAGQPCVFVRLTACDLRCSWCDTPYAFHEGTKRSLDSVFAEVETYKCPLVEVTGGEPLLQADVYPLMESLLASGRTVL